MSGPAAIKEQPVLKCYPQISSHGFKCLPVDLTRGENPARLWSLQQLERRGEQSLHNCRRRRKEKEIPLFNLVFSLKLVISKTPFILQNI